jgi:SAM-dependent methyltransferase
MNCRHCGSQLNQQVLDLGFSPPSNSFLTADELNKPETYFPLRIFVCGECWLIQTADFVNENLVFPETYVYFSSTSSSWLEHAKQYSRMIVKRLSLTADSKVIEVASNDGYLLKNFNELGIPNFGIEPTKSTADAAEKIGVETVRSFFTSELADELCAKGDQVDLLIGNNVYAHVPNINDFTLGISKILKPNGVVTLEFPHAANLVTMNQFDTVYHEHFSYLSLIAVQRVFSEFGLRIFDVEKIPTHGGSLRVYGCLASSQWQTTEKMDEVLQDEIDIGMKNLNGFNQIQKNAQSTRNQFVRFLINQSELGHRVIGYGAAAKGNTLLNFCGVKSDLIQFVVDGAEAKQNKFLPGSHIPVFSPAILDLVDGDNVIIFPWNIAGEISPVIRDRFGKHINIWTPIPELKRI